ncbi:WhiB family transcriptional regulator [Actinomadura violacea]|uniref:WhiB family transcriptional regulator n=1 Tax=Actinomadura violacea TaxID=2819934 RepID=A0ABS3RIP6_9ACTN|nr:WhiB family transcriptional regulator [Actinomadura violacea]MBO2456577.1 WhiB family transcriptional regulator [Actinomadura violacea]
MLIAHRSQPLAFGAQATKHAAEGRSSRSIAVPDEVTMSRFLSPSVALAGVDLRGEPITGAQCRFDPDLHTGPDAEETPDERAARELVAKQVCESCPLRGACLELAMRIRPEYGVWAGFTAAELATLAEMAELADAADSRPSDLDLNEVA